MAGGKDGAGEVVLSVVIPVLDDAAALAGLLAYLQPLVPATTEIVVVDGGSADGSADVAKRAGCTVISSPGGRGGQLAHGAEHARGNWIWMLHADARPSPRAVAQLLGRAHDPAQAPAWGRFRAEFRAGAALGVVAAMMDLRSRISGICTGDQAIFVHRKLLSQAGGVPPLPLMEDIELSRRLKRLRPPDCREERVAASPRRWQSRGTLRTILAMWWLRWRYWRGAEPARLAREYYRR